MTDARMNRSVDACTVCGCRATTPIITVENMPALCNAFAASASEARSMPRAAIELTICTGCGMVRNAAFDPSLAPYDCDYENSLHHSPKFQAFAADLADRLVARQGAAGGTVVEIGSGGGDFLTMLVARGYGRGYGFDPSLPGPRTQSVGGATVEIVPGTIEAAPADLTADLVVSRHVLEHLPDPVAVLREARHRIARAGTRLYVEVPDAGHMLRTPAVWDLIYEHVNYFTEDALAAAVHAAGWADVETGTAFGGQYAWAEAVASDDDEAAPRRPGARAERDVDALGQAFAEVHRTTVSRWAGFVERESASGRRVAVWGAGSKGVTFMNIVDAEIEAVVDVNPRKHGRFVPGTGTRVEAPAQLVGRVDTVLVMNPLYLDEIRRAGEDLGLDADFVAVD
jgi:SAM-dependent methyltransferase